MQKTANTQFNMIGSSSKMTMEQLVLFVGKANEECARLNKNLTNIENGFVSTPKIISMPNGSVFCLIETLDYRAHTYRDYNSSEIAEGIGYEGYKKAFKYAQQRYNADLVKMYHKYMAYTLDEHNNLLNLGESSYYFNNESGNALIDGVHVLENWRHQGIAYTILSEMLANMKDRGIKNVSLHSVNNINAKKLYEKLNFSIDYITNFVGYPFGLFTPMVKKLSDEKSQVHVVYKKNTHISKYTHKLMCGTGYKIDKLYTFIELMNAHIEESRNDEVNVKNNFVPYGRLARGKNGELFAIVVTKHLLNNNEVLDDSYLMKKHNLLDLKSTKKVSSKERLVTKFDAFVFELDDFHRVGSIYCKGVPGREGFAYIDGNHVEDDYQGKGISSGLVATMLEFLSLNGYTNYKIDNSRYDSLNCRAGEITPAIKQWLNMGATLDSQDESTIWSIPMCGTIKQNHKYTKQVFPIVTIEKE